MSQFNKPPQAENIKPELVSDYRARLKLPEVSSKKVKNMSRIGYAIQYQNGSVLQVLDIKGMKINPENLPVAISRLGKSENSPEQKAK